MKIFEAKFHTSIASMSYIELGTIIPESGGEYTYLLRTFGQLVGFLYSWIAAVCMRPASYGIIVQAFANYAVEPFYLQDGELSPEAEQEMKQIKMLVTVAGLGKQDLVHVAC